MFEKTWVDVFCYGVYGVLDEATAYQFQVVLGLKKNSICILPNLPFYSYIVWLCIDDIHTCTL